MPRTATTVLLTALVTVPTTAAATWWLAHRPTVRVEPATPSESALARAVPAPPLTRSPFPQAAGAERVAATDMDGDGRDELALAGERLRVVDLAGEERGAVDAPAGIQVLEAFGGVAYGGWGRTRTRPEGRASVVRYALEAGALRAAPVLEPEGERPQIVSISPSDAGLVLAWFADKYLVQAGLLAANGSPEPLAEARTAPVWLRADLDDDGAPELVIGRTYGDAQGSDGDAVLLRADGSRVPIPTTRGVRAGCLADTNGDGQPEVVLADGWDKDYGHKAVAQLRLAWLSEGAVKTAVLDVARGDNDALRILADDIDGDGRDEIVWLTNNRLRVVEQDGEGWVAWDAAEHPRDVAVVHDGDTVALFSLTGSGELVRLSR